MGGTNPSDTTSQISNAKLFVLVAILSIDDNIKFIENIKQGFKRTVKSNNHSQKTIIQTI